MELHSDALNLVPQREVFTVSELNREARRLIEKCFGVIWVEGEVSNLARPSSGHMYWSLKDDSAQIRCAMFRQHNRTLQFSPENGKQILARGRISLYETRGEFQMVVDFLEEAGEGQLRRQFEELKRKLATEGLFDTERKKPLPVFPRRVGVITSPSGAAVRDILTILRRRFPAVKVLVYPTPVQGEGAAEQIAEMLKLADGRGDCDLLILARGGGSLEDLWSFNQEVVARALAAIETPVISAVGHEVDFTIADFVADVRAPTPSAAAELAAPEQSEWLTSLNRLSQRLSRAATHQLAIAKALSINLGHRLSRSHPGVQLRESTQRLDDLEVRLQLSSQRLLSGHKTRLGKLAAALRGITPQRRLIDLNSRYRWSAHNLEHAMLKRIGHKKARLELAARALQTVSPLGTLDRGYAIVTLATHGGIVTDTSAVEIGSSIIVRLSRGELIATVDESRPAKDETKKP
ncbi:MAG: exodeoxyribonuclease VII large subunit [Candidatus Rariloculaceae bacterium]